MGSLVVGFSTTKVYLFRIALNNHALSNFIVNLLKRQLLSKLPNILTANISGYLGAHELTLEDWTPLITRRNSLHLTSGRPAPCIFNCTLQSGPKALPLYLPIDTLELSFGLSTDKFHILKLTFILISLPKESSVYFDLFSGCLTGSPPPLPDGDTVCLSKCGRKKVAAPASKKVLLMESSLIDHTTSQPVTS